MDETTKALAVCLTFFTLMVFFQPFWEMTIGGKTDFVAHYNQAKDQCPSDRPREACLFYPPLYYSLSQFFTFRPLAFFYFGLFLIFLVMPLLLFRITGSWVSAWFYFTITGVPWDLMQAHYAQALAMALVLLVFLTRKWVFRLGLLLLSLLAHSKGMLLVLIALIGIVISEKKSKFYGVVPFFDFNGLSEYAEHNWIAVLNSLFGEGYFQSLTYFYQRFFPLPFLCVAVYSFFIISFEYKLAYTLLILGGLIGGIVSARATLVASLFLLMGITHLYLKAERNHKGILLAASLVSFAWVFWKVCC